MVFLGGIVFSLEFEEDLLNGTCIFQFPESLSIFQPFTGFINSKKSNFAIQKYAVAFPLLSESRKIESIGKPFFKLKRKYGNCLTIW